jgi:Histone methylation protein DOT1
VLTEPLRDFLTRLEADLSLLEPNRLQERLNLLDDLDTRFCDFDPEFFKPAFFKPAFFKPEFFKNDANGGIHHRAKAIRTRLETVNAELYQSIRSEIMHDAQSHTLLPWIQTSACHDDKEISAPTLAYDYRDELISGILQIREPNETQMHREPEMVFYQPTPIRHILHLIKASSLSKSDIFVDLGSGLGHVALLASILTGAQSLGIEVEAAYAASAQECAQSLHLSHVRFIHQDARAADLSSGTVFYLYSPFTGSILADVLEKLRKESTHRPIKICTLGPCACTIAQESWLQPNGTPHPGQITVFRSYL